LKCRHCGGTTFVPLIDLGIAPLANAFIPPEAFDRPEKRYPLRVSVCASCWLAQTEDFVLQEDVFGIKYPYFSSFSASWLAHSRSFVEMAGERFCLDKNSLVVELAANDGYLLQYVQDKGIPCYGVEPTASTAKAARDRGIEVIEEFFGEKLAKHLLDEKGPVDFLIANNVLAHVPALNDFVQGIAVLLKPDGVASIEVQYLVPMISGGHFDTIYHEHYSYYSLSSAIAVFQSNGLMVFDVERLPTHGGSIRIFACRQDGTHPKAPSVERMLQEEQRIGVCSPGFYAGFEQQAKDACGRFVRFLQDAKAQGETVAAYGATAKGNTLLNYAGIDASLIAYVADRNPAKQNCRLPGSGIPVVGESHLNETMPRWIVLLAWNIREELVRQLEYTSTWRGQLVIPRPQVEVVA
jgi:SAM-dependent methyltransferase